MDTAKLTDKLIAHAMYKLARFSRQNQDSRISKSGGPFGMHN